MDSLLFVGQHDTKLARLMARLGYDVVVADQSTALAPLLTERIFDLILLDSQLDPFAPDLLEYLRSDDATKQLPLIMVTATSPGETPPLPEAAQVEFLEAPVSPGALAGKIAVKLRLRKMVGESSNKASLLEINAALRDHNSRLQKDLEEARVIQESLLPETLPQHPAVDLAVSYDPLQEVGGDWYFARTESDGKISLLIADVTGHGLAAAFIGSMAKLAHAAAHETEPGKLLTAMNRLMTPQLPAGRFVTMCSVLFDPTTGEALIARAGHPPCSIVSGSGASARSVAPDGFPLGFMDDASYDSQSVQLEVGDSLVLLTDGILEARNRDNQLFGNERIVSVAKQHGLLPAREIAKAILIDLTNFCDGRAITDDVTLLVLKRKQ